MLVTFQAVSLEARDALPALSMSKLFECFVFLLSSEWLCRQQLHCALRFVPSLCHYNAQPQGLHAFIVPPSPSQSRENEKDYLIEAFKIFQTANVWSPEITSITYYTYQHNEPRRNV